MEENRTEISGSGRKVEPISPQEVVAIKALNIPNEVLDVFNKEIAAKWNGHSCTLLESDVAQKIASALSITVSQVYELKYLNVEPIYRKKGWKVEYDKPGYCETYPATYTFSSK